MKLCVQWHVAVFQSDKHLQLRKVLEEISCEANDFDGQEWLGRSSEVAKLGFQRQGFKHFYSWPLQVVKVSMGLMGGPALDSMIYNQRAGGLIFGSPIAPGALGGHQSH